MDQPTRERIVALLPNPAHLRTLADELDVDDQTIDGPILRVWAENLDEIFELLGVPVGCR